MRKLIIMRGPQGSGKSTILERSGLDRHAISLDAIRETISGAVLSTSGDFTIAQEHGALAWRLGLESLTRRIETGETIAFDATLPKAADVEAIANEARAGGYDVLVVDRFGCDLETAFTRNMARPEHKRVPRKSFDRTVRDGSLTRELDPTLQVIDTGDDLDASVEAVCDFLRRGTEVRDLSAYERIVHVGDLQGCLEPLLDARSPVDLDDPSAFFIFHGDLLDRGIENGRVLRWWLDHAAHRENVALIAGNHEDHIEREAQGLPAVSREFERRTLPQLVEAGITREDLAAIAASFVPFVAYTWRGIRVLASHAGFPRWPDPIWLVPEQQLRKGAGHYQAPVDQLWSDWSLWNTQDCPWQVHGHRNQDMLPIIAGGRSINLEGQVEFGGHMRFAVLDATGWTPVEIRNLNHKTMQEFRLQDIAEGRPSYGQVAPLAPWAARGETRVHAIPAERFDAFRAHEMVQESVSETLPHVSAFNFSKQAFWTKAWDEVTMHTRGLFVNTETREIVARAYPKFFNRGERHDTRDEALSQNLCWPVRAYTKENGFLGISGYDSATGELVLASKSRIEGSFAGYFREIAREVLGEAGLERLLRFNRDQVASCVFEVVDPVNDPHIIEEAKPRLILLDAIRRDEQFEAMPYEDLVKLAKFLGCEVKQVAFKDLPHWDALVRILDRIENDQAWRPTRTSGQVEGVVVEDASGFQFKVKAAFYAQWKRARGAKDRVASVRRKGGELDIKRYEDDPLLVAFVEFCQRQPDDVLERDIVWLRNAFLADPTATLRIAMDPPVEPIPDQTGFLKGVDAIFAQVQNGRAKAETVIRLVARAGECPHRQAAFEAHPAAQQLREFAAASQA